MVRYKLLRGVRMKVGDLVNCYGWMGIIIDKHEFGQGGLLVYWIHNRRETWRDPLELELINESR